MSQATCETCGNADFQLQDGYFFCSVCQTQSQDIREEKTGDDYIASGQQKLCIRSRVTQKEKTKENAAQKVSWTTNDGFNIILRKMVDILIKMGASPQLKNVVKQLWFVYLKKTQHAFCPTFNNKEWTPKLPTLPRERDVQVLSNSSADIVAKKYRRAYLHKMRNKVERLKRKAATSLRGSVTPAKKRKKLTKNTIGDTEINDLNDSKLSESIYLDEALSLDDFDITKVHKTEVATTTSEVGIQNADAILATSQSIKQDPDPVQKPSSTRKNVYSKKQYSKEALKLKTRSIRVQQASVTRMSMSRVLEFLYLGLLLLDDQILLCDLIRWVRESWLPLREAAHLLPDEFGFQTYDTITFRLLELPENKIIRSTTAKLAKFLELSIERMPKKSVQEIASRFILDLKLPSEFHQLLHNLASVHPNQFSMNHTNTKDETKVFSIPNYEGRALAFIIVILKLLFGLDGKSEKKQDKFSRKLDQILPDVKPFIWEDWTHHIVCRRRLLQRNFIFETTEQPQNCTDVDQLVGYYVEKGSKAKGKLSARRAQRYRTCKEEVLETLRQPFRSIATIKTTLPLQGIVPTIFPYSSRERKLIAENTNLQESNLRTQDFRKTTVQHLIHPERFRTEIENKGGILEIKESVWNLSASKTKPNSIQKTDSDEQSSLSTESFDSDDAEVKKQGQKIGKVKGMKVNSRERSTRQKKVSTNDGQEQKLIVFEKTKKAKKHSSSCSSAELSTQTMCVYQPFEMYGVYHYKRNEHGIFNKLSSQFPSSFGWLVDVLSDMGGMKAETLYEEVMLVERVLVYSTLHKAFQKHLVETLW